MAQREESFISQDEIRKHAQKLSEPEALRRMAKCMRDNGGDPFTATMATVFESCADRIEHGASVGTVAKLSAPIKKQLEEMAEEMGLVADESFWKMDLAFFAFMKAKA